MITSLIKSAFGKAGLELRRLPSDDGHIVVGLNPPYLSLLGHPKTVIDVGVGFGTNELYEAFPSVKFLLVEPLRDYAAAIDQITARYNCVVEYAGASDHDGRATIHVDPSALQLSSLNERTTLASTGRPLEARDIELKTLDAIYAAHPELEPPFFLKIDTEGHELAVLRGSERVLQQTETLLIEVSIAPRFSGGYRFDELIAYLADRGFEVAAIVNVAHAYDEVRSRFADVAFRRRG